MTNDEIGPEHGYDDDPTESPPGDRPPTLSFPLSGSQDPSEFERPPVVPVDQVQLPHWTEPASGTVPEYFAEEGDGQDLSAWSSLGSQPVWRGDEQMVAADDYEFAQLADERGGIGALASEPVEPLQQYEFEPFESEPIFDDEEEEILATSVAAAAPRAPSARSGPAGGYQRPKGAGRNMPMAIAMGLGMFALAIASVEAGPRYVVALVAVVVVLAANELYTTIGTNTDLEPAWLVGLLGSGGAVVAAYNYGEGAIPLVLFLTLATALVWHLVGAANPDTSVLRGSATTVFGVVYIGVLGSYAGLMMALPAVERAKQPGMSFFLGAVLCTIGYDIGAFFVGRRFGTRPLSLASPNKTIEGLLGGLVGSFVVGLLVVPRIHPWEIGSGALLGIAVFAAACIGDLVESLIKRDMGIKDMSSLLPGHGGLLDRFDGLLFALPIAYYLGRAFYF